SDLTTIQRTAAQEPATPQPERGRQAAATPVDASPEQVQRSALGETVTGTERAGAASAAGQRDRARPAGSATGDIEPSPAPSPAAGIQRTAETALPEESGATSAPAASTASDPVIQRTPAAPSEGQRLADSAPPATPPSPATSPDAPAQVSSEH